jgi:hypothetical protein
MTNKKLFHSLLTLALLPVAPLAAQNGVIADLEERVIALEALVSEPPSPPTPLPRQAFFSQSATLGGDPDTQSLQLIAIDSISEIQSRSTDFSLFGYMNHVRVFGKDFGWVVGLFPSNQASIDYVEAFADWIRTGGTQPRPEDFGGVSSLLEVPI